MPRSSRSRHRIERALLAVAVLAVGAVVAPSAAAAPAVRPARPAPGGHSAAAHVARLAALQQEVAGLYQQAESADSRYDTATQAVAAQQAHVVELARAIVGEQAQVETLTELVGEVADAQYTGQAFADSPTLQLLLADNPDSYLVQQPVAQQGVASAAVALQQLQDAKAQLAALGDAASAQLGALTRSQAEAAAAVADIKSRLATAQALLGGLSPSDLAALEQLAANSAFARQMAWRGTLTPAELARRAHGAAQLAIDFAVAQIGKPYLWGGTGPNSFDCSGLTMRAWQAAGVTIPRTSQEQWAGLRHVPVTDLQPGDLIVYFRDASHVALYVGDGAILQAPHPGGVVELAAAGSMPILGVVRPG